VGITQEVLAAGPRISVKAPWRPGGHRHLHGSDFTWAIAFVLPYVAVFFVFVVYPFGYALWMASKPALYAELITDPSYLPTVVNTLLFVGLGVNVKMFLALLVSVRAARGTKHDCCGDAGPIVRRRRRPVERDDGRCHHVCAAADCALVCPPPPHRGGPDDG
jgi:hypothetical protein